MKVGHPHEFVVRMKILIFLQETEGYVDRDGSIAREFGGGRNAGPEFVGHRDDWRGMAIDMLFDELLDLLAILVCHQKFTDAVGILIRNRLRIWD